MSDSFKEFIEKKRVWYQSVGTVFCPLLNTNIVFNAKGFRHLRYNGIGQARPIIEQTRRMRLLIFAGDVIKEAKSIVEYKSRYEKSIRKHVDYWEFQKRIDRELITVIIRRVGTGSHTFYSIWGNRK